MNKKIIFVLVAVLFAFELWASSPSSESPAIYVVNMQKVIDESIIGKAARNDMESEVKNRESELAKKKLEVQKYQESLEKQANLLSEEALDEKKEQLRKKAKEFERSVSDHREEITKKNSAIMSDLVSDIREVISEIAKNDKIQFIVEKDERFVVYVNEEFDLTDRVIKTLDEKKVDL